MLKTNKAQAVLPAAPSYAAELSRQSVCLTTITFCRLLLLLQTQRQLHLHLAELHLRQ